MSHRGLPFYVRTVSIWTSSRVRQHAHRDREFLAPYPVVRVQDRGHANRLLVSDLGVQIRTKLTFRSSAGSSSCVRAGDGAGAARCNPGMVASEQVECD